MVVKGIRQGGLMADAGIRLLHRRVAVVSWVALWAAVAAVLLTHFAAADLVRLAPSPEPHEAVVPASIRVVRMTASETTLEVTVLGRPDLAHISDSGLATLTDSAGNQHFIRQGSIAGRTLTLSFDGSASVTSGRARVDLPRVGLTNSPIRAASEDEHVTYVALELLFELAPTAGSVQTAGPNTTAITTSGYGATVTSIVRDDESVVVLGRLDGFTREEIQLVDLRGTLLVLADGSGRTFVGGTAGNGPELRDFSFNFNVPRSQALARFDLHVRGQVPPIVRAEAGLETRARLESLEARGEFILSISLEP